MKSCNTSEPLASPYQFETLINKNYMRKFVRNYWHYVIYVSIVYFVLIYFLQSYMKTCPAFDLKWVSVIWNGFLAFYSILSTVRIFPVFYFGFLHLSFYCIICNKALLEEQPQVIFWLTVFSFSKVWELGDTVLIILRKRNLMILHWYHHIVTLITTWYGVYREISAGFVFCYLNAIVHSLMYTYFCAKCLNVKIPKIIAMFITVIQTLQMLIGIILSVWILGLFNNKVECDTPTDALMYFSLMYLSYFCIFSYLFYVHYVKPVYLHHKKN